MMECIRVASLCGVLLTTLVLSAQPIRTLAGEGFVTTVHGRSIVVYVDTNADDSIDERVVLMSESVIAEPVTLEPQPLRVEIEPGRAVVLTPRRMIELAVPGSERETRVPAAVEFVRYAATAGLAHHSRETFRSVRTTHAIASECENCDPLSPDDGWSASGGGSCDAGGCPSTSCSVSSGGTSCTVSCPAGYCACCKYGGMMTFPSCKCVK